LNKGSFGGLKHGSHKYAADRKKCEFQVNEDHNLLGARSRADTAWINPCPLAFIQMLLLPEDVFCCNRLEHWG
jgi:hypothetical protein